MNALLELRRQVLHSGQESNFKLECDALSDDEIETCAYLLARCVPFPFAEVEGVPRGGLRLAEAMQQHRSKAGSLLVVDDVLTTGSSIREWRRDRVAWGAVIFARGACPAWVTPLFTLHHRAWGL